jgi:hypothetical protein
MSEFSARLKSARASFEVLRHLLESAGEKLDALKTGEQADIDYQVAKTKEYLWRYNDDLEAARDLWLRFDLSEDDIAHLNEMLTPVSLGLPMFADDGQAARASQQINEIGERLRGRLAVWDSTVTAMKAAEVVGDVAGVLAGTGIIFKAVKTGGKWAVVKAVAAGAAAYSVDYAAEKGLRAAGAGDQSIRGTRLAAAVIGLILLRRGATPGEVEASPNNKPQAPTTEVVPGELPSGGTSPRSPSPPPKKPPLPPPRDEVRWTWKGHRTAAEAEEALARRLHELPDEVVVSWGAKIGIHGPDVVSVNMKTGEVTLWDSKFRSASRKIEPSPTFQKPTSRAKSIEQAKAAIMDNTTLPESVKQIALQNLEDMRVQSRTVGAGNIRNSTLQ